MRQLVAIIAVNVTHSREQIVLIFQLRLRLVTLTRWMIWQLIICLPACSKFTVTFSPTIDCTWPCPQSGWSGCVTKSPRLKYNIGASHALSCNPYVPQRCEQDNLEVRTANQTFTNIARLVVSFFCYLCVMTFGSGADVPLKVLG